MQVSAYLSFTGECEAAFDFYVQHLGATRGSIHRYAGSPLGGTVPPDWEQKVMHGSVTIGGLLLMGADVVPQQYEQPKGFSLSIQLSDVADAERMFRALSAQGRVVMPLEKTFWAERFGMVVDRFSVPWIINCGETGESA